LSNEIKSSADWDKLEARANQLPAAKDQLKDLCLFTIVKKDSRERLDYIFTMAAKNGQDLKLTSFFPVVADGPMPNDHSPSDHFPIAAEFMFVPKGSDI